MFYDDNTLKNLSLEQLKLHENNLITSIKTNTNYWLSTYLDNQNWSHKIQTDVECLTQVRKYIFQNPNFKF